MEKEIYTPMERILIEGLKIKQQTNDLLELDEMLLKMEAQANMMDGLTQEEWLL